jgi:hypothetical protein
LKKDCSSILFTAAADITYTYIVDISTAKITFLPSSNPDQNCLVHYEVEVWTDANGDTIKDPSEWAALPFSSAAIATDKFSQCNKYGDGTFDYCINIDSSNVRNINNGAYSLRVKTWIPLDAHTAVTDPAYIQYQAIDLTVEQNCGLETITPVSITPISYKFNTAKTTITLPTFTISNSASYYCPIWYELSWIDYSSGGTPYVY